MSGPTYQPGEVVGVAIERATVLHACDDAIVVRTDEGFGYQIPLGGKGIAVLRMVPVDGVPRKGDVWADSNGTVYMAMSGTRLLDAAGGHRDATALHRGDAGPIRLVFRPDTEPTSGGA